MKRISWAPRIVLVLLAGILGIFIPRTFLQLDDASVFTDGYASQVMYVLNVLSSGSDFLDEKPLFFVHLFRALIAVVFQAVNGWGGPALEIVLLSLFVWPVLDLFIGKSRRWLGLVLFFLVFMLSFRSVLVCLSIGYLFLYQLRSQKSSYLAASFLFGSLSSGAVLLCVLLVLREGPRLFRRGFAYVMYTFFIIASLAVSLLDKFEGFNSGDSGYEATVGNSTGIFAAISRNTIVVSLMEGDYMRATVYILIAVMVLVFLTLSFIRPKTRWYRYVFIAGLPVLGMEGLGVVALIIPLMMVAADVYLPPQLVSETTN